MFGIYLKRSRNLLCGNLNTEYSYNLKACKRTRITYVFVCTLRYKSDKFDNTKVQKICLNGYGRKRRAYTCLHFNSDFNIQLKAFIHMAFVRFFFLLCFYAFFLSLFNIKQSFSTRNTNKWYMSMWWAVFIEKTQSCCFFLLSVVLCPATFLFACTILPFMWRMWSDMSLKCDVLKHVIPVSIFDFRFLVAETEWKQCKWNLIKNARREKKNV